MALFSAENAEFAAKLCESEHIPAQKRNEVAGIAGYVLLGFLHPEDLAKELRDALQIDIRITTAIASAINDRIFKPLRSDIDSVYKPIVGSVAAASVSMGTAPKILEEIRPVVPVGAKMASGVTPGNAGKPLVAPVPPVVAAPKAEVVAPKPPSAFVNLQKTEMGKIPMPVPQRPAPGAGAAPLMPSPKDGAANAPQPMIIKTDAATMPIAKAPDFVAGRGSFDKMAGLTSEPPKPTAKPAVLEFGAPPKPPEPSKPKVVNYADRPVAPNQSPKPTEPPIPKPPGK